MRTKEEVDLIKDLYEKQEVKNVSAVARKTGIPLSTIRYILGKNKKYVNGKIYTYKGGNRCHEEHFNPCEYLEGNEECYSFLLGAYLGDGHIIKTKNGRTHKLSISNNEIDCKVIAEQVDCLKKLLPNNSVSTRNKSFGTCVDVIVHSKLLPLLFPQHGKGKKHERPIILEGWQKSILDLHPKHFLKGLFWSDGCRYIHRQGKYSYLMYNFVNCSKEIKDLCGYYLKSIGVKFREHSTDPKNPKHSKKYTITIPNSSAVILEDFVGPKR